MCTYLQLAYYQLCLPVFRLPLFGWAATIPLSLVRLPKVSVVSAPWLTLVTKAAFILLYTLSSPAFHLRWVDEHVELGFRVVLQHISKVPRVEGVKRPWGHSGSPKFLQDFFLLNIAKRKICTAAPSNAAFEMMPRRGLPTFSTSESR